MIRRPRTALVLSTVVAVAVISAGCATSKGTAKSQETAGQRTLGSQCGSRTSKPLSLGTVTRVFAKHGIAVRRLDGCHDPEAAATITNLSVYGSPRKQREALAAHGRIICELYDASRGSKVTQLTFNNGRDGVTYSVLNVSCDVYPTSPTRYLEQDHALERIVRDLSAEKNA